MWGMLVMRVIGKPDQGPRPLEAWPTPTRRQLTMGSRLCLQCDEFRDSCWETLRISWATRRRGVSPRLSHRPGGAVTTRSALGVPRRRKESLFHRCLLEIAAWCRPPSADCWAQQHPPSCHYCLWKRVSSHHAQSTARLRRVH